MPKISATGSLSSRGFGEFAKSQTTGKYIENYFSTYLYTGNGAENTFNTGVALSDTLSWTTIKFRQTATSLARSVAVDSSGNFYVGGTAYDGQNYILVAKFNSTGTLQWQRKIRQNASSAGFVSFDSSGNVYVVGTANNGTANYASIVKYDSSGTIQWQRKLSHASTLAFTPGGMFVDSSSNVYVGGTYGSSTYQVVAKYNSSGVIQWQRRFSVGAATTNGYGVATDSSGNVYFVGDSAGFTINKYNSSGVIQWQRVLGATASGRAVTVDSSNNIYVTGQNADKILLAKYNDSGVIQWQRTLVDAVSASNIGTGITTDASGNVYLVGRLGDTLSGYACVAKYNSSGALQWQRKIRQSGSFGYGISVNSSGTLLIALLANDGANYGGVIKMTTDGDLTSGTAFVTMVPGAATSAIGTETEAANTGTDAAGPAVDAAGTATDSAGTATFSSATQSAVTGTGGLVWIKGRSGATDNALYDTVRGATNDLVSNSTAAQTTQATGLTSFFADGFSIGALAKINSSAATYASWTFRKQNKFFDIVTYTGNGAGSRTINHNLGSTPGMIIIKRTDGVTDWNVYHRSIGNTGAIFLNSTAVTSTSSVYWSNTSPTSTNFTVGSFSGVNASGGSYVAYLFAHDAGGFGTDETENVISCGSYTGNGSATGPVITLGYEPQFVMVKATNGVYNWLIEDVIRNMNLSLGSYLSPSATSAEAAINPSVVPNATGFSINTTNSQVNASGTTYIYMAIRRGKMQTPTTGTSVFSPIAFTGGTANRSLSYGFPVDVWIDLERTNTALTSYAWPVFDRLLSISNSYFTSKSTAWSGGWGTSYLTIDNNTGVVLVDGTAFLNAPSSTYVGYGFARAKGFFDVVNYAGSSAAANISHNLGVVPELIIIKKYSPAADWWVYAQPVGNTKYLVSNTTAIPVTTSTAWNNTSPTSSVFSVGTATQVNVSGARYSAYLFATCPGVSKVGSYTGTGTNQTINCGFSGGARFVMIKRTDTTGDWYLFDTARGMVFLTDPYSFWNAASVETNANNVYTTSTGFELVSNLAGTNATGGTYIFLAIA